MILNPKANDSKGGYTNAVGNVSDELVVNYCIKHLQIINDLY